MAAITGMLARLVCWSIGNASLSLPALPRCWLRFPTRSQDFSCCSLLGSHPVGQGERWRESCPAVWDGWHERGPQPWHHEGQWKAFNNKSVKKAIFFFFPLSRRKHQESWRSCYYGMALPPSVPSTIQHHQPSLPGLGGSQSWAPLLLPIAALPLRQPFPCARRASQGPQSLPCAQGVLGSPDACRKGWQGREGMWDWH